MVRFHRDDDRYPYWAWETLQHELGHCAFNMADEYNNVAPSYLSECGHTFMGGTHHMVGICNARNHYKDPQSGASQANCNPVEFAFPVPPKDGFQRLGLGRWDVTLEYALFAGSGFYSAADIYFDAGGFTFTVPRFQVWGE